MLVINRLNYGNPWWKLNSLPTAPLASQQTDIIETHWTNWLAQDRFLQPDVTKRFIDYYTMVQKTKNRYVAKNTEQLYAQWLYKKYTKVTQTKPGQVEIDNTNMPQIAYVNDLLGVMVLKVPLKHGEHITQAKLNGKTIPAYFEQYGWAFLYLPVLQREKYTLTYQLGHTILSPVVYNDGTYNVYSLTQTKHKLTIDIKMYGTQTVKIYCPKPKSVTSSNKNLKILSWNYDSTNKLLEIHVKGVDIQGERGYLTINL
jgi:hypothetical protein